MKTIITPADLPQYVPGEIWLDAVDGRWNELSIRGYKYKPSDISAPRLSDYLIVLYTGGPTKMSRHVDGPRLTSDIMFGAEIASATGFSDQSHMTRNFKRQFGTTPQECRREDSSFPSVCSQDTLANTRAVSQLGSG